MSAVFKRLRQPAPIQSPVPKPHSSQNPDPRGKLPEPVKSKDRGSWHTGSYYSNSGILNPYYNVTRRTPSSKATSRSISVSSKRGSKAFHPNVELRDSVELKASYPVKSLVNSSRVEYDPIFHTARSTPVPTTRMRLKGLGELLDRARLHNSCGVPEYSQAISANPKVFHKCSGEFSRYYDECVKFQAEPFSKRV